MRRAVLLFRQHWAELAFIAFAIPLCGVIYGTSFDNDSGIVPSRRNKDFPITHIGRIHLDVTSPKQNVDLTWVGPEASTQDTGPFPSSVGRGWGANDCNEAVESNCPDSRCTPKGVRKVEGFRDHMKDDHQLRYVTLIDARRGIAFHSHVSVPPYPASLGCVRLAPKVARLIYDNSIAGVTEIVIDGQWSNRNANRNDSDIDTGKSNEDYRNE
jgi:hypothetical protein